MHNGKPLARLGVIVASGLFTVGLAAFAGQTAADSGNGNGGNSEEHRNDGDRSDSRRNDEGDNSENGNDGTGGPADQVVICHAPPGNADNEHTIEIGSPAVDAHVENHDDDSIGPCDTATSTTTPASTTTTVPTSTSTTTTSTTSTSSTTSSSSTSPVVAPDAAADIAADAPTGQAVNLDVLANDVLGDPAATITQTDFDSVGACSGLSFDLTTGSLSGAPTETGACLFTYVIQNSAGFDAAAVLVLVVA
jgi:hypothetical protein